MVARILVSDGNIEVDGFLRSEGLVAKNVWSLKVPEGGVKIAELRSWLKANYLSIGGGDMVVFWVSGADNLSETCQNILLKPLEESREEALFVLVVRSASRLLPTIVSRCQVDKMAVTRLGLGGNHEEKWRELMQAWESGPGASVALLDKWGKGQELEVLSFFIKKLAKALRSLPSKKRVEILKLALELRADSGLMVHKKLLLGRFLLEGYQISGLDSSS